MPRQFPNEAWSRRLLDIKIRVLHKQFTPTLKLKHCLMQSTRFKVVTGMDKNRYKQQFYDDLKKIAVDIIKIELDKNFNC